jgi:DNA-binding XRE family transcriptional regulator
LLEHLKALKQIRNAAGLTQLQLANKLGVSQPNVARLESNWETSSIQQAMSWLDACSVRMPRLEEFTARLCDAPIRPEVRFAIDMETVLRNQGEHAELHRKPVVVVLADDGDSTALQATCVRSLMEVGDAHFNGFYLPPADATVIWKHVSSRPHGKTGTVAVMKGGLRPWMLNDPIGGIEGLQTPDRLTETGQGDRYGNFAILDGVQQGYTVIVYWDHPLLLRCDLVQIPPPSLDWQNYANGIITARADLRIICAKNGSRLSATSILALLTSARALDFVVLEDNRAFEHIQNYVIGQFGARPVGLPLNLETGLRPGSGLLELANRILSLDAARQDETCRNLTEIDREPLPPPTSSSHPANFSAGFTDTRTAAIAKLLSDSVGATDWTPDFERVWLLANFLGMPRHDPTSSRLDIDSYVSQVKRAIEAARMPSIQHDGEPPLELQRPTPQRHRMLANQLWRNLRGSVPTSDTPGPD